jgi:NTP pyrophosphatase (non-canonical NTP hydrolase)
MALKALQEYQREVSKCAKKFEFRWSNYVQFMHLVEEVGELGEAITVREGDRRQGPGGKALADHADVREELGDVLFTVLQLGNQMRVDMAEVLDDTLQRYQKKLKNYKRT